MLKDSDAWWYQPLLALGLPKPKVLEFLLFMRDSIDDFLHDPARREAAAREAAARLKRLFTDDRSRASHCAADKGIALFRFRKDHGRGSYIQYLREVGVSPRTARHLMNLGILRWRAPRLFDRFASLGPTRLYRLAVLPDDLLHTLDPDRDVEIDRTTRKLRHLTDRELILYLRKRFPPDVRKKWPRIRKATLAVRRWIENAPPAELVPRETLAIIRDAALSVVNRLEEKLRSAS